MIHPLRIYEIFEANKGTFHGRFEAQQWLSLFIGFWRSPIYRSPRTPRCSVSGLMDRRGDYVREVDVTATHVTPFAKRVAANLEALPSAGLLGLRALQFPAVTATTNSSRGDRNSRCPPFPMALMVSSRRKPFAPSSMGAVLKYH